MLICRTTDHKYSQLWTSSMNSFIQDDFFAVEPNFFNVFSFNLIAGDPATAFDNPRNMIITLETAQRYFDKDLSRL